MQTVAHQVEFFFGTPWSVMPLINTSDFIRLVMHERLRTNQRWATLKRETIFRCLRMFAFTILVKILSNRSVFCSIGFATFLVDKTDYCHFSHHRNYASHEWVIAKFCQFASQGRMHYWRGFMVTFCQQIRSYSRSYELIGLAQNRLR